MKKYDLFISLGEKCFVAQTLEKMNIRDKSYPFDWLEISETGFGGGLCDRLKIIENHFANFFDKKDLHVIRNDDIQIIYNKRTNLNFRHELKETDKFVNCYAEIAKKYERRTQRLLEVLASKKNILLIYSSSIFGIDKEKDIKEALQSIRTKFHNPKIDLLVVKSDKTLNRNNNINITRDNGLYIATGVDLYKPVTNQQPSYYIKTMTQIINKITKIKQLTTNKIIISLTSFPARINDIHVVIKSLMNQSIKPDKIILYLTLSEFPSKNLPKNLTDLQNDIFEIRWTDCNYRSYNKLVHTLVDFPHDTIITVDDDILYPRHLIRDLLKQHKKHPSDICAHRIRTINIVDGKIQQYKTWKLSEKRGLFGKINRGYTNFFCGVGGVLYPPKSLYKDVLKSELFTKLCKHQDDVWFWAMAVLNNRKISVTRFGYNMRARTIEKLQMVGLWNTINKTSTSPNNTAIDNVIKQYPQIKQLLKLI